ncbi:hypothetical protein PR202_ga02680 [Eleusine coracana subsp. coracana]|uniref:TORTIFOLIA1/SINE1-2 N-terminal domain-containing protein n=1 Tax=Eleusine coracana subsp. coracana TaxID=191504 RepID=A0AAV5BKD9_ELECO|nr:hypothetical protein PR202_ga02680 [Eleusine coracana subsp. coracana]
MGTAPRREPLKQRVNRCLLKLADRDTETMAAAELEAIARALDADELPAFVSAVSDARPTDKTPLRRHSLRALALVAASHPRDAVAPLVPRILAAALRRVRDQDSSVRAALVDAARAAAAASASASAARSGPSPTRSCTSRTSARSSPPRSPRLPPSRRPPSPPISPPTSTSSSRASSSSSAAMPSRPSPRSSP